MLTYHQVIPVFGVSRMGGHRGRHGQGLFNIIIILVNKEPRTFVFKSWKEDHLAKG